MITRSQGPANSGQEIVQELVDQNGNLIWRGMEFELAGKKYNTSEFVPYFSDNKKLQKFETFKI